MNAGLIPQRYAKALYKFAKEQGDLDKLYSLSKNVIEAFVKNPDLTKTLANPYVSDADKEKLLKSAARSYDDAFDRFIKLIIGHKRVEFAYEMMLSFRDIYRKEHKISQVKITTASELAWAQIEKLRKLVEDSFKDRTLEFSEEINPELIGGFIIDVDSVRLDASLSSELEQLRQSLIRS